VSAGVILSIGLHLYKTSKPHVAEVGLVPGTQHFRNIMRHAGRDGRRGRHLRIDESLYFANARFLEDLVQDRVAEDGPVRHVVLMCSAVNEIDMSALESLEAVNTRLRQHGGQAALVRGEGTGDRPLALPRRAGHAEPKGGRTACHSLTISRSTICRSSAELDEDTQRYFEICVEKLGLVPNVLKTFSRNTEKLKAFSQYYNTLMLAPSGLSQAGTRDGGGRRVVGQPVLLLSRGSWTGGAELSGDPQLGEMLVMNYRVAQLSDRQRAMLDFAWKLTTAPGRDRGGRPRRAARRGARPGRDLRPCRRHRVLQHVQPFRHRVRHDAERGLPRDGPRRGLERYCGASARAAPACRAPPAHRARRGTGHAPEGCAGRPAPFPVPGRHDAADGAPHRGGVDTPGFERAHVFGGRAFRIPRGADALLVDRTRSAPSRAHRPFRKEIRPAELPRGVRVEARRAALAYSAIEIARGVVIAGPRRARQVREGRDRVGRPSRSSASSSTPSPVR
jgi:hypothetical protein